MKAYGNFMSRIGDPLDDGTLYGPMHSQQGIDGFLATVKEAQALGGKANFPFAYHLPSGYLLKCSSQNLMIMFSLSAFVLLCRQVKDSLFNLPLHPTWLVCDFSEVKQNNFVSNATLW